MEFRRVLFRSNKKTRASARVFLFSADAKAQAGAEVDARRGKPGDLFVVAIKRVVQIGVRGDEMIELAPAAEVHARVSGGMVLRRNRATEQIAEKEVRVRPAANKTAAHRPAPARAAISQEQRASMAWAAQQRRSRLDCGIAKIGRRALGRGKDLGGGVNVGAEQAHALAHAPAQFDFGSVCERAIQIEELPGKSDWIDGLEFNLVTENIVEITGRERVTAGKEILL